MFRLKKELLPSLLLGVACRKLVGGYKWRGLIVDRLRTYYLLINKNSPVKWNDLKKFSILKSDNSLSKMLGHLINDNYIVKPDKAYVITCEGREDYETLLRSLNCYVLSLLHKYLSEFPDCSELRELLQKCKNFDLRFYEHAIARFDDLDELLMNKARAKSRKECMTLEKALINICCSIDEILDELVKELCGE